MVTEKQKLEYYQALIYKDSNYEGIFYVGVRTTRVFCRPTCPARKPKYENCEFFIDAEEALLSSYRPCKRCSPLSLPNQTSIFMQELITAIEKNPEKRWKNQDLRELSIDSSTVRRQFKKRFGMTFIEYARARRIGLATKEIRAGQSIIEAQLDAGYESSSGFRDAFYKIMGAAPSSFRETDNILKIARLDTQLGPMVAIASNDVLYLLEFVDRMGLEHEIKILRASARLPIIPGITAPIRLIEKEIAQYFKGDLKEFKTPTLLLGTNFQKSVWEELKKIPYGETISYLQLAININSPKACRAVANANGANQICIVVPCHRVINNNGKLGGYSSGIARKEWLLNHEKNII